jgi:hypothetical protein
VVFFQNLLDQRGYGFSRQSKYGFVVGPELQALVITGVNLILRKLSKEAIIW